MARAPDNAAWALSSAAATASIAAPATEPGVAARAGWRKPVAAFVLLFGAAWVLLLVAYELLPFVRPGADIVYEAKFERLIKTRMFDPRDRYRLMVFGHSKVLAGVRPHELDAALGPRVRTYNLGLPGELLFLPILEAALAAGNIPTHVILTLPWDDKRERVGVFDLLRNDAAMAKTLFPFRSLPRDALLFVANSRGAVVEAANDAVKQRDSMLEQRGWYFIKSQSRFADHRLPDGYALPTDRPRRVENRLIPASSAARERLVDLAVRYGFQVLFVPADRRSGEVAPRPAAEQDRVLTLSEHPPIRVLGPDYWVYPPSGFSDPLHMNPAGASAYTSDLAVLLRKHGVGD